MLYCQSITRLLNIFLEDAKSSEASGSGTVEDEVLENKKNMKNLADAEEKVGNNEHQVVSEDRRSLDESDSLLTKRDNVVNEEFFEEGLCKIYCNFKVCSFVLDTAEIMKLHF